jgi:hypothetical protein
MTALLIVYRLVLQRSAGPDIPTRWPRRVGRGYESRIPQQLPIGGLPASQLGPLALPCGSRWAKSGTDNVRSSVTMKRRDTRRSVLTTASHHAAVSGTPGRAPGQDTRLPRVWAGLSAGAALLAIAGSAVGLLAAGLSSHTFRKTVAITHAVAARGTARSGIRRLVPHGYLTLPRHVWQGRDQTLPASLLSFRLTCLPCLIHRNRL